MLDEAFSRTEILIGREGVQRLRGCAVMVCGLGGVGSSAAEAVARAGVGRIVLVDHDAIDASNINRQIHAGQKTIGQAKAEAMRMRVLDINPACCVSAEKIFIDEGNVAGLFGNGPDYVIDAMDTVAAKVSLAAEASKRGVPIISAMGTANRFQPGMFEIIDIYKTTVCPLAKAMRRELKKKKVRSLACCYSAEPPAITGGPLGSISFVPAACGLMVAGHAIRGLLGL